MTPHEYYAISMKLFVTLLAIANPIGAIPVFLMLTSGQDQSRKSAVVRRCTLAVTAILIGAIWGGDRVLEFFGIGVPAFRAGGGILILLMAIAMLHARNSHTRQTPAEAEQDQSRDDVAIVPLAIPFIAGPGAISLAIVASHKTPTWDARLGLTISVIVFAVVLWILLRLGDPIARRLGETGLNIVTRLMGLILVAVGVQMVTSGLKELLPGLAG